MRRDDGQETMFTSITYFVSTDAVRAFAGDDPMCPRYGPSGAPGGIAGVARPPPDLEAAALGQRGGLGFGVAGLRRRRIRNPGSLFSCS